MGYLALVVLGAMLLRAFKVPSLNVGVALLFFGMKFAILATVPFFANHSDALNIAVFSVVATNWLYHALWRGQLLVMLRRPRLYWLYLGYLAYLALSMLWSPWNDVLSWFWIIAPYLVVFAFVIPTLLDGSKGMLECYQWMTVLGGVLSLIFLIASEQLGDAERLMLEIETAGGEAVGFNPLAVSFMGAMTVIAATLGRFRPSLWMFLVRGVVCTMAGIVTGRAGRGELIAGVIAVVLVGSIMLARVRLNEISLVTVVGGGMVVVAMVVGFYLRVVETSYWHRYENLAESGGALSREEMIRVALDHFWSHPLTWLFGSGWGTMIGTYGYYPHNSLAQNLTELGFVGLGLWSAVLLSGVVTGVRALWHSSSNTSSGRVVAPALAFVVCLFVITLKAGDCLNIWLSLAFAVLVEVAKGPPAETGSGVAARSEKTNLLGVKGVSLG